MGSRKAPQVKRNVIKRRLAGQSKRAISQAESISRGTVDRILGEAQIDQAVAEAKSDLLGLVPDCVEIISKAVKDGLQDPELFRQGLDSAHAVLKGLGIYEEKHRSRSEVRVVDEYANRSREELETALRERLEQTGQGKPN
jgi:hypothetical protein